MLSYGNMKNFGGVKPLHPPREGHFLKKNEHFSKSGNLCICQKQY